MSFEGERVILKKYIYPARLLVPKNSGTRPLPKENSPTVGEPKKACYTEKEYLSYIRHRKKIPDAWTEWVNKKFVPVPNHPHTP